MSNSSREFESFHTGLMAFDYYRYPAPPYRGKHWHIEFISPTSQQPFGGAHIGDTYYPAKEVVIRAHNQSEAQRAADLIHSVRLVLDGSAVLSHLYPGEHAPIHAEKGNGHDDHEGDGSDFLSHRRVSTSHIPLACLIAARASLRLVHVYALAKLRLSLEMFSVPVIDLDPYHSPNIPKSPLPEDHIRLAFAVVAAWSCIEELGFEIRASAQKPSKLPDGKWNPVVKAELEQRLTRGHINVNEGFYWNLRGQRTRIERKRPPNIVKVAPWARYDVRDGEMAVIDAIHYVSYLRT